MDLGEIWRTRRGGHGTYRTGWVHSLSDELFTGDSSKQDVIADLVRHANWLR